MTTPPEPTRPKLRSAAPGPRRLTRSVDDRVIAGVCGGFAAYAGIDANLIRIAMVALTLFGGTGLVLYLVAWLLLPQGEE